MAGDWLKMDASTPEKPEVLKITAAMGWDDPDVTVGKLFRVWRWFDQQTVEGNAPGVSAALLDRSIGVSGFCEAMANAGWLVIEDDGLRLPNFDRHNGKTAKDRALTAKRVAKHKTNDKGNAASVSGPLGDALPREEKRREDIDTPSRKRDEPFPMPEGVDASVWADWLKIRKAKKAPLTKTAWDGIVREAGLAGMTPGEAVKASVENGWQGFKADWLKNVRANFGQSGTASSTNNASRFAGVL